MVAWLTGAGSPQLRLTLAGLGQGLIITGVILAVFALLYRLLVDLREIPVAQVPQTTAVVNAAGVAA